MGAGFKLKRFVVWVTLIGFSVASYLYVTMVTRSSLVYHAASSTDTVPARDLGVSEATCAEVHHFAFIKVHKAGSSVIENINFRFGLSRNLTFLLPTGRFMVSMTLYQPWVMFLPPPNGRQFDILTNHAVYNKLELSRLLPHDTQYTAILRHPYAQMKSALYYFAIIDKVPGKNISLYLENPKKYHRNNLFSINCMSRELGIDPHLYTTEKSITKYIESIKDDFRIVIILERLDESLVLLKRYFCWSLKDIIVKKKNVNRRTPRDVASENDLRNHRVVSLADYMLYEYYSDRLNTQILAEGHDFQEEVTWYREVNQRTIEYCATPQKYQHHQLSINGSAWNSPFTITSFDCRLMNLGGYDIVDRAKVYQYGKENITKEDILMSYRL